MSQKINEIYRESVTIRSSNTCVIRVNEQNRKRTRKILRNYGPRNSMKSHYNILIVINLIFQDTLMKSTLERLEHT